MSYDVCCILVIRCILMDKIIIIRQLHNRPIRPHSGHFTIDNVLISALLVMFNCVIRHCTPLFARC